jgi:hypothetical protein
MRTCAPSPSMSEKGSKSEVGARNRNVRFPPDSDQTADIAGGPFRANTGSRCSPLIPHQAVAWRRAIDDKDERGADAAVGVVIMCPGDAAAHTNGHGFGHHPRIHRRHCRHPRVSASRIPTTAKALSVHRTRTTSRIVSSPAPAGTRAPHTPPRPPESPTPDCGIVSYCPMTPAR